MPTSAAHPEAVFLRRLADHLDEHQVAGVMVHWVPWAGAGIDYPVRLQLTDGPRVPQLVAWAASFGTTWAELRHLTTTGIDRPEVYIYVPGRIGDMHVVVWTAIEPLPALAGRDSISVADLAAAGAT